MTNTKRSNKPALAAFVAGAPDAAAEAKPMAHPSKTGKPGRPAKAEKPTQISMSLPADLLADMDRQAVALRISGAAFIKQALSRAVMAESS